jgi:hypothetical protein
MLMLSASRDIQGIFSAIAFQDIQEMDFTVPHSLLEVSTFIHGAYLNAHFSVAYYFPGEPAQTFLNI